MAALCTAVEEHFVGLLSKSICWGKNEMCVVEFLGLVGVRTNEGFLEFVLLSVFRIAHVTLTYRVL
jgi:hypothetical protein